MPLQLTFEDLGDGFDIVANRLRKIEQHPFRHIVAYEVDLDDRKIVGVLLGDDRLFRGAWQLRFCAVDCLANVGEGDIEIVSGIELDQYGRDALGGERSDLLDAFDRA